jgi:hypothetical protein
VEFPRALRVVRDTGALSAATARVAESAPDDTVHVRELSQFTIDSELLTLFSGKAQKAAALRVPAFTRAYKLFTHTISCFPLREYVDGAGVTPRGFLSNPSQLTTYPALMARTIGDLICHDTAYWRVTSRAWDGYPATAEWMPYEDVRIDGGTMYGVPVGQLSYRSEPLRSSEVIRFDGDGTGGWLATGVSAVNLAASLLATVVNTAEVPAPSVILKNSGADLTPAQVDALLEAWETARTTRTTAYLNSSIDANAIGGYSPNDLQLVESRNAAATDLARNANLDPIWVGAGVPGSSVVYANRVDLRKDLLDLAFGAPMAWVAARLSQPDVTPRGHVVGFDTDAFLRANTSELADVITKLGPEIVTTDEARALLDFGGNTP